MDTMEVKDRHKSERNSSVIFTLSQVAPRHVIISMRVIHEEFKGKLLAAAQFGVTMRERRVT